jgi:hypothetical protein
MFKLQDVRSALHNVNYSLAHETYYKKNDAKGYTGSSPLFTTCA